MIIAGRTGKFFRAGVMSFSVLPMMFLVMLPMFAVIFAAFVLLLLLFDVIEGVRVILA